MLSIVAEGGNTASPTGSRVRVSKTYSQLVPVHALFNKCLHHSSLVVVFVGTYPPSPVHSFSWGSSVWFPEACSMAWQLSGGISWSVLSFQIPWFPLGGARVTAGGCAQTLQVHSRTAVLGFSSYQHLSTGLDYD